MSYIPALAWSEHHSPGRADRREPQWREKPRKDMQAFLSGQTPAIAEPYRLTSLAGAPGVCRRRGARRATPPPARCAQKAPQFILPQTPDEVVRFATGWTDDMFMASSVLSRVDNGAHARGRRRC